MNIWSNFNFNNSDNVKIVDRLNDVALPLEYLEFMKKHDGGEGEIGPCYVILYKMDELAEVNQDYCVEEYLPQNCIIGSNGGGELFGIDKNGNYFTVPAIMDEKDKIILGRSLTDFLANLNQFFTE